MRKNGSYKENVFYLLEIFTYFLEFGCKNYSGNVYYISDIYYIDLARLKYEKWEKIEVAGKTLFICQ